MFSVGLKKNIPGVFDFDLPKPAIERADEALVRLKASGICGSDKSLFYNNIVDAPAQEEFLILGHEGYGVVEEVGKDVKEFKPGDIVVPTARRRWGVFTPFRHQPLDDPWQRAFKKRGPPYLPTVL